MGLLSSLFGVGKKKPTGALALDDITNRAREITSRGANPYPNSRIAPFGPALQQGYDKATGDVGRYEGAAQLGLDRLLGVADKQQAYDKVGAGKNGQAITTGRFFDNNPNVDKYFNMMYQPAKARLDDQYNQGSRSIKSKYASGPASTGGAKYASQGFLDRNRDRADAELQANLMNATANIFGQDEARSLQGQVAQGSINAADLDRDLRASLANQSAGMQSKSSELGALQSYMNGINQMYNMNKGDLGSLAQYGGLAQKYSQSVLDDNVAKWNEGIDYDWNQLTRLANLIRADPNADQRGERKQNTFGSILDAFSLF